MTNRTVEPVAETRYNIAEIIAQAGGIFLRDDGVLVWFNDPVTQSTLNLFSARSYTVDQVKAHIDKSHRNFFPPDRIEVEQTRTAVTFVTLCKSDIPLLCHRTESLEMAMSIANRAARELHMPVARRYYRKNES